MSSHQVKHLYFEWLCKMVCRDEDEYQEYREMFRVLYDTVFEYSILRDANREADGLCLRDKFVDMHPEIDIRLMERAFNSPCSVLEVVVALADRMEIIMSDPEIGDRTIKWFWIMLSNLGLEHMDNDHFDEDYILERLNVFMRRQYDFDGSNGGLFIIPNPRNDLRKTEIWYQMNWYLSNL